MVKGLFLFVSLFLFISISNSQELHFYWAFSTGGEGNEQDIAYALNNHYLYTTGFFEKRVDFAPDERDSLFLNSNGKEDIFVRRTVEEDLVWAISIGGKGHDQSTSITTNHFGDFHNAPAFVTGFFEDTVDFNPQEDTLNLISTDGGDFFYSKTR